MSGKMMINMRATTLASAGAFRPTPTAGIAKISPAVTNSMIIRTAVAPVAVQQQSQAAPPPPPDMPILGTQNGHLLSSWPTADVKWYLPDFVLADDIDPKFEFAATQSGVDASGNPFNKLRLTLGLRKVIPQDVAAFKTSQPTVQLREVWLAIHSAIIALTFKDSTTGADQQALILGSVAVLPDGSVDLVFENILGVNVIILFENLRNGGATLNLAADYSAWQRRIQAVPVQFRRAVVSDAPREMVARSQQQRPMIMLRPNFPTDTSPPILSAQPGLTSTAISYPIPLGQKYAANAYLSKYTIASEGGPQRPIISVDDLRDYNNKQSEFRRLLDFGDVSQRYASIARLYLGVLSRTIVVIPSRYAIVRLSTECAASCQVLLDSAAETGGAKFQFQFLLAADTSPVDLAGLAQDIGSYADLKDCTVTTPSLLRETTSTLDTIFKSSVEFGPGSMLHCFALSVDIIDSGAESPAVANANLLIRQLCAPHQPYLSGTLELMVDDTLSDRIQAPFVLNFRDTVGNDGLLVTVDEAVSTVKVANQSAFDLNLKRYAFCTHSGSTVSPLGKALRVGESLLLPLPADHIDLNVLMDSDVMFDGTPPGGAGLSKYIDIRMQDVQNVHCMFGVNAGAVAFASRSVAKIDATISFIDLPDVAPVILALTKGNSIASANVPIPIRAVVGSLGATIGFTVHYEDAQRADDHFSLVNDFLQSPIFVLPDAALSRVGG
jgi:hypothetical protein